MEIPVSLPPRSHLPGTSSSFRRAALRHRRRAAREPAAYHMRRAESSAIYSDNFCKRTICTCCATTTTTAAARSRLPATAEAIAALAAGASDRDDRYLGTYALYRKYGEYTYSRALASTLYKAKPKTKESCERYIPNENDRGEKFERNKNTRN